MLTALAVLALILGVVRLVMFIALHVVPSEYNIVNHAVSDYAVGPTRKLGTAMTWTSAVFWAVLAGAVIVSPSLTEKSVAIWLLVLTVLFVVLPFLPTDIEGQPATLIGRLHLAAAVAWFAISYSCMGNFVRMLQPVAPQGLVSFLVGTRWVTMVSLIALVAALVITPARKYAFGISERIFLPARPALLTRRRAPAVQPDEQRSRHSCIEPRPLRTAHVSTCQCSQCSSVHVSA